MIKKFTYIFVFALASFVGQNLFAQQDAQYSQFMFNRLSYNPAFAGSSDKICATLLGRNQWNQFGGGNVNSDLGAVGRGTTPTTILANIHAPIGRFGIGANFNSDELGFSKIVTANATVAYKQPIGSNGGTLAGGIGVGFVQEGIDGTKLKAIDPNDPKIPTGNVNDLGLDLNFGLYYTQEQLSIVNNFYAGISSTHLNAPKLTLTDGKASFNSQYVRHYYFTTGAEYELNSAFTLNPNILVKTDLVKTTTDINATLIWNQNVRGGISYRTFNDLVVMFGYNFQFPMKIGYSYDLTMGKILNYSTGTHEIMLSYCFGIPKHEPKQKVIVPRLTPRFL